MKLFTVVKFLCLATMATSLAIDTRDTQDLNTRSKTLVKKSDNIMERAAGATCNSPCETDSDCTGICEVCRMGSQHKICTKLR
ncbi:hypothetical protein ASPWEDRAFT_167262 [Aspergillus wentii DTO 134E9]|uniref:Uncharacterized protein n=1 Tax=Aspergillus wentii DTO 134E9 TaxID=1073089 RepID=A0A1L9S243_ASPWE|nr:uncharacterized protein ASPWEDRAFT_167262 [Aspergillus wentii DTO 134E9]KAI9924005.1 hypothetical protein MW887_007463 [Aspergillus wentii]OJJ41232.1 hypothetical protein ASPWEDRAFT_167262 [Aspergillus wentii DTO 134E9]